MVRMFAVTVVLTAFQAPAFAQGRPDTLRMPCAIAAGLVRSAGAIVLGTGPNIYDRYVASRAFCQRDEQIEPRWLATSDTPQCLIGYSCERQYGNPSER
jgi:hypothetical protein